MSKIKDNFAALSNTDGLTAISGVWKLKNKLFPKNIKALPMSKKDAVGRLVSSPDELKNLYIDTYVHRLRHRPIRVMFKKTGAG